MLLNYYWSLLFCILIISILIDLRISLRNYKNISISSAIILSLLWIGLAITIGILIYFYRGLDMAVEFITAYCIELSLSIDNVFVFIIIFKYFNIKLKHQHKVLFLGILGAIIFRLLMIIFGIYINQIFKWIFLPFSVLLIYSGYKLPMMGNEIPTNISDNFLIKFAKKYFNYSKKYDKGVLYFYQDKKIFITPLALALLIIEKADIIFALDSIPAVLTITKDPFIAFSSNILAILGLRSMYFIMVNVIQKFKYLKYGIGYILMYMGIKIILRFFKIHISNYISIFIILLFIISSIIFSVIRNKSDLL